MTRARLFINPRTLFKSELVAYLMDDWFVRAATDSTEQAVFMQVLSDTVSVRAGWLHWKETVQYGRLPDFRLPYRVARRLVAPIVAREGVRLVDAFQKQTFGRYLTDMGLDKRTLAMLQDKHGINLYWAIQRKGDRLPDSHQIGYFKPVMHRIPSTRDYKIPMIAEPEPRYTAEILSFIFRDPAIRQDIKLFFAVMTEIHTIAVWEPLRRPSPPEF